MLAAILAIICTLILVVGVHEAGHALSARFFGVEIKKISIGFGRPLLTWHDKNGCEWIWALWPLGGYVQLLNSRISPVDIKKYPLCFDKKPVGVRIIILLAGALTNALIAWLALVLVFYIGKPYQVPQIQSVQANSIAAQAGIKAGDQLLAVEGRQTPSWTEAGMELVIFWGDEQVHLQLSAAQNTQLKEVTLDLSQVPLGAKKNLLAGLGIEPNVAAPQQIQRFSLLAAIHHSNQMIVHTLYFFVMILKQVFTAVIPFSVLLGPLGLFAASIASFTQGFVLFLFFIAQLSLVVALVNLFPIPGLDGGSIVYALVEKIRGKPASIAMEVLLYRLVLIAFSVVLVHLLMNDLSRFL